VVDRMHKLKQLRVRLASAPASPPSSETSSPPSGARQ
jgi:hypothetical protein